MQTPTVDYRKLRLNNISSDEYKHLKLLLFWPVFGLLFLFVERFYQVDCYYTMYCGLDVRSIVTIISEESICVV